MSARIPGAAEPTGTRSYAESHREAYAKQGYRDALGVTLSTIGLGTYLGELGPERDRAYRQAVTAALSGGINVIDSAINYRHQRSERVVGEALRALVEGGQVQREAIFVSTKGGYIPFDADERDPRAAIQRDYVAPGLLTQDNVVNGAHCIDPDYLQETLRRSRANLQLETIDLYYVHNPETQLSVIGWGELRERLEAAFQTLEEAVEAGEIRHYGIATWTGLRVPPGDLEHVPLVEVLAAAEAARGTVGDGPHHLRAVQAPLNLGMPEAVERPTQPIPDGRTVPLAEACDALGLAFFTSASILQGRLARDLPAALHDRVGPVGTDAQVALQATRSATGVTTALVGMATKAHVAAALALLAGHPPDAVAAWERASTPRA